MDISLALKARLPFIHVKSDDLLYIGQTLTYLAGESVEPLVIKGELSEIDPKSMDHSIYYTGSEIADQGLYMKFKAANKTLVFVNTKPSALFWMGGVMVPPKEMVADFLGSMIGDENSAKEMISAFGGMTLKDSFDAVKLTVARVGKLSTNDINTTRQGFMAKAKGIVQVDSKVDFYQTPGELSEWMAKNAVFFTKPVVPDLTPRGLLLDGPPGTGKTAASKFIADAFQMPLYRLDVGAMKGKYVGDSEGNLNAALAQIDQVAPCVVILDEVEKVFAENHDSGVSSSMLSSLLWWLQEHKSHVFTVMTTNNRHKIPPELYREGRIDKVMDFKGLENHTQSRVFAKSVWEHMASRVWKEGTAPEFPMALFNDWLGGAQTPGHALTQGRVTEQVKELIKTVMMGGSETKELKVVEA